MITDMIYELLRELVHPANFLTYFKSFGRLGSLGVEQSYEEQSLLRSGLYGH